MSELPRATLEAITGGDCYDGVIELFGLEIGIRIGSCQMN